MDLTARGRVPEVGITAHDSTISFRITASGTTEDEARLLIEPTARLIYERFGSLVVGEGTDDVPEATVRPARRQPMRPWPRPSRAPAAWSPR